MLDTLSNQEIFQQYLETEREGKQSVFAKQFEEMNTFLKKSLFDYTQQDLEAYLLHLIHSEHSRGKFFKFGSLKTRLSNIIALFKALNEQLGDEVDHYQSPTENEEYLYSILKKHYRHNQKPAWWIVKERLPNLSPSDQQFVEEYILGIELTKKIYDLFSAIRHFTKLIQKPLDKCDFEDFTHFKHYLQSEARNKSGDLLTKQGAYRTALELRNFYDYWEKKGKILPNPTRKDKAKAWFDEETYRYFTQFLKYQKAQSQSAYNTYRTAIPRYFKELNAKSFRDLNYEKIESYFMEIDKRDLVWASKKRIQTHLFTFYEHICDYLVEIEEEYLNPVPTAKEFLFSKDTKGTVIEREKKIKAKYLTVDQIYILIKTLSRTGTPYDILVATVLLAFTGARPSEIVSIRLDDMILEKQYFESGFAPGHQKEGRVCYVYPEELTELIKNYRDYIKATYPDTIWLFPKGSITKNYGKTHISTDRLKHFLKKINPTYKLSKIRNTFIKHLRSNAPIETVNFLTNHALQGDFDESFQLLEYAQENSVEDTYYALMNIEYRQKQYHRYFPAQYKKIAQYLEFL